MSSRARELLLGRWESWTPSALVGGAVLFFVLENRAVRPPIDDGFIFYRYAQHFADGHGLVYNIGERVEGFTSLLWTLLVALGVLAGGNAIAVGHWLGVASGVLLLLLSHRYAAFGLAGRERLVAALSPWLIALSLPFALWATSGLETPLFAAAILAALIAESRGRAWPAVAAATVAFLIRPEGVLVGGVIFASLFFKRSLHRTTWFTLLFSYLGLLTLLTVFRVAYFGSPLPNTFYAKVGGTIPWWGVNYVGMFLAQTLLPMLWPSAYALGDRYLTPGLCFCGFVLISVLAVGGDSFHHGRFFLPALPILSAAALRGAIRARKKHGAAARFASLSVATSAVWLALGVVAGLVALIATALTSMLRVRGWVQRALVLVSLLSAVSAGVLRPKQPRTIAPDEPMGFKLMARWYETSTHWVELKEAHAGWSFLAFYGETLAHQLDARPPADKLVATLGIGAFGYYSKARVVDIVGLVDPTIARSPPSQAPNDLAFPGHQRANARYLLWRRPDYILIPQRGTSFFQVPAVLELWNEPEFERRYRWDATIQGYRLEVTSGAALKP